MRQGQNNRRSRGRTNNRRTNTPNRNQTFDSNGPDTRIRGNASQVLEKYQALARDAMSSGDPVMVENYLQHAEHYQRVINQMNEAVVQAQLQAEQAREQRPPQHNQHSHEQPNGHDQPMNNGTVERSENAGAKFEASSSDPREQPSTEFGRDPREENQPAVVPVEISTPEASTPDAATTEVAAPEAAATEVVETAEPVEPVAKPRRRRPRRVKVDETASEPTIVPAD